MYLCWNVENANIVTKQKWWAKYNDESRKDEVDVKTLLNT